MKKLYPAYAFCLFALTSCSLWSEEKQEQQPTEQAQPQPEQPAQVDRSSGKAIAVPTGLVLLDSLVRNNDATSTFNSVIASYEFVVVDFFATWCGPCKTMSHVLEATAKADTYKNKVVFLKINTETFAQIAKSYGIRSIPTLIFFKNGKKVDQVSGALSADALKSKLRSTFGV